ncbi:MAG: hypothetical protein ACKOA8_09030 [Deltaproteobacteria bacterium]
MKNGILSLRNSVDFFLRNNIKFSRPVSDASQIPERDKKIQQEFREFFSLFPWEILLKKLSKTPLTVVDIGARNFVFGPIIDETLRNQHRKAHIHGIELDAHRLLWGFHSRADFGDFYARQMRSGFFHAMDFLTWSQPIDLALLLNPFVSEEPLLSWGLPLSKLKPYQLFEQAKKTLLPNRGILILSCPSPEELEIAKDCAQRVGFIAGHQVLWKPSKNSIQQKPRYGIVYYSELCS